MQDDFLSERGPGCRPIWLVTETGLEAWLAGQPATITNWIRANGFKGERHRLLVLPGGDGGATGAVFGLGRTAQPADVNLWHTAALPERLPDGRWYIDTPLDGPAATRAALGWAMGRYRFDGFRKPPASPRVVSLVMPAAADAAYVRRAAAADALARNLVNTPAGDLGPAELAAAAAGLATAHGAACKQVVGEELLQQGLTAIHAVGRAGPQPPRLVDLTWGDPALPKVTLVGKGVCFDTGGLDLKPAAGMALMKKDMGGAAMALGLAHMVMDARLPVRLRVLLPAVENSLASNAYRPGDVVRTLKGLSVEIGNTDAEGRVVLADALALADTEQPELLIDLATLTGAARVALGPELPALFCSDETLAAELELHGTGEADPVWHMPLWTGYEDDLASKVADVCNVAPHAFAGAVMGALFLRRFVADTTRWVHLDLFAWNTRDRPGRPVGAECQGVRALYRLLAARYPT